MQLEKQIQPLSFPAELPDKLLVVDQHFDAPEVGDLAEKVRQQFEASGLLAGMPLGSRVAVGVGSRGIREIVPIARAVVDTFKAAQMRPFIIPAMGSHGGATPEGQIALLADLGITSESMGVDIRATMDVRLVGKLENGPELFQDAVSASAEATFLINRVKPHTDFNGVLESGISKMAVIGLGKRRGAEAMHSFGGDGFRRFLAPAARVYESQTNLLGGLALVENANGGIADLVVLSAHQIGGPVEQELLERARTLMARLPFEHVDVLVVRQLGKNFSGTGMDTNVIGRLMIPRQPEPEDGPDIAVIAVLDLSPESEGNGAGIGLANVIPQRLADKVNWKATYTNAITSGIFGMQRVSLPITMPDDRRTLQVALRGCGRSPSQARMVWINNTSKLGRLWVSPNLKPMVENLPCLSIAGELPLAFSEDGLLISPWQLDR